MNKRAMDKCWAVGLVLLLAGCAARQEASVPTTRPGREQRIASAIERGVAFLVRSQNADGSWGRGQMDDSFLQLYSMVPGSHDAYRVATTALCAMALRGTGQTEAHGKAIEYLVTQGYARRDDGSLLYNTWAHMYAVEALAGELAKNPDPRLRKMIAWHLDMLERYETYVGGWGYYDFLYRTQKPSYEPTSFGTASGLVALRVAQDAGVQVNQAMVGRAIRRLREMRTPDGSYLYSLPFKYRPTAEFNLHRGAVGRIQPCNYALWLWEVEGVGREQAMEGLEILRREGHYLEMGRKRPYPHDSWYQTAPYYYYYDYYYASRLIEKLGEDARRAYGDMVLEAVIGHQEADGSWWDFAMWDYHKPYGTAFAVMTLRRLWDGR